VKPLLKKMTLAPVLILAVLGLAACFTSQWTLDSAKTSADDAEKAAKCAEDAAARDPTGQASTNDAAKKARTAANNAATARDAAAWYSSQLAAANRFADETRARLRAAEAAEKRASDRASAAHTAFFARRDRGLPDDPKDPYWTATEEETSAMATLIAARDADEAAQADAAQAAAESQAMLDTTAAAADKDADEAVQAAATISDCNKIAQGLRPDAFGPMVNRDILGPGKMPTGGHS
jgi:hypothetical protein